MSKKKKKKKTSTKLLCHWVADGEAFRGEGNVCGRGSECCTAACMEHAGTRQLVTRKQVTFLELDSQLSTGHLSWSYSPCNLDGCRTCQQISWRQLPDRCTCSRPFLTINLFLDTLIHSRMYIFSNFRQIESLQWNKSLPPPPQHHQQLIFLS